MRMTIPEHLLEAIETRRGIKNLRNEIEVNLGHQSVYGRYKILSPAGK